MRKSVLSVLVLGVMGVAPSFADVIGSEGEGIYPTSSPAEKVYKIDVKELEERVNRDFVRKRNKKKSGDTDVHANSQPSYQQVNSQYQKELDRSVLPPLMVEDKPYIPTTAIHEFDYEKNKLYPIYTREGALTEFRFPQGERVQAVYFSDSRYFSPIVSKDKRHVLVVPTKPNKFTSGKIVTNKAVYELAIESYEKSDPRWYPTVVWRHHKENSSWGVYRDDIVDAGVGVGRGVSSAGVYIYDGSGSAVFADAGKQQRQKVEITQNQKSNDYDNVNTNGDIGIKVDVSKVKFRWKITSKKGNPSFVPERVFDDGKFVYVMMPVLQDMPAVFAVDAGGTRLVNYVVKPGYIQIQRVPQAIVLKLDGQEVIISRKDAPNIVSVDLEEGTASTSGNSGFVVGDPDDVLDYE